MIIIMTACLVSMFQPLLQTAEARPIDGWIDCWLEAFDSDESGEGDWRDCVTDIVFEDWDYGDWGDDW